jgi:hypothetical protein
MAAKQGASAQIKVPKDVPCKGLKVTTEDRRAFTTWGEEEGWCSCCGAGQAWEYDDGRAVAVAHIGSRNKNVDVAICRECLAKMTAALPSGAAEVSK